MQHICFTAFYSLACSFFVSQDLCSTIWCRVDNKCLTRLEAAAEGTMCGDNKVREAYTAAIIQFCSDWLNLKKIKVNVFSLLVLENNIIKLYTADG